MKDCCKGLKSAVMYSTLMKVDHHTGNQISPSYRGLCKESMFMR